MTEPTQYIQVTNTLGYQVTIPLVGPFEAGIALNTDQIGFYTTTPIAPDDSLVRALQMVNTISSAHKSSASHHPTKTASSDPSSQP
ncbi:MAG: hypothetical protein HRU31_11960 [Rhodobacteraceae bacterium]|nr:hypothetical protein [Paracoccaceae bacterium]